MLDQVYASKKRGTQWRISSLYIDHQLAVDGLVMLGGEQVDRQCHFKEGNAWDALRVVPSDRNLPAVRCILRPCCIRLLHH